MMINLMKLPEEQLNDYYRELLRRGWIWLIVPNKPDVDEEEAE